MSRQLLESIVDGDYISAEHYFHDRLDAIMEQKLYEEKKRIASINEIVKPDPKRPGQFVGQNTKADWAKYRRQNKLPKTKSVEPEPAEFGSGKRLSAGDVKRRRKAGYLQAHPAIMGTKFIQAVHKYKETGKLKEGVQDIIFGPARQAAQAELEPTTKPSEPPRDATNIAKGAKAKVKDTEINPNLKRLAPKAKKSTSARLAAIRAKDKELQARGASSRRLATSLLSKAVKKLPADPSMSPEARRGELERKRQQKIDASGKMWTSNLMTPKEKLKTAGKLAVSGAKSGFVSALASLREQKDK